MKRNSDSATGAQHTLREAKPVTATSATNLRDSFKRTADSAILNEGGKGAHILQKARRAGQFAGLSHSTDV